MSGGVRVEPFTRELIEAAIVGDDELAAAAGARVVPGWATFREALAPTRDALVADPALIEWGPRLFVVDGDDAVRGGVGAPDASIVGWGGFKAAPRDGVVELGYEIAESMRGRGLATAAARIMRDVAFADGRVSAVIAHTLAETNASNHILLGLGFRFDGALVEADETGDMEIWRYRIDRVGQR